MPIKLTSGKIAGLTAVSDHRGVIAALAMDQRDPLEKMLARELGVSEPPAERISEFKQLVAKVLTQQASSILLDVKYGLQATKQLNGKGLLLAYEKAGYGPHRPEKLPIASEGWSALRLKEAGANAIKILVYYTPFEKPWINEQKKAWIERVGAECRAVDIPLFLEFLGYDVHGEGGASIEYARRKPEVLFRSIEEFSKERYGVDVLKIEIPVQMAFVEGTSAYNGQRLNTRTEAKETICAAAALTGKPIVYLSAGVSNQLFVETLELVVESGAEFHGVLCGRATWQDGVPVYAKSGPAALEDWLNSSGLKNVESINKVLESARPWSQARDLQGQLW
jgi:tagatose 1,6-diphosphate aldolase